MVKHFCLCAISAFVFFSCGEQKPSSDSDHNPVQEVSGSAVAIGTTGYTIELLDGYRMENQNGGTFDVYYFKPIDTAMGESEAGIYFGPRPDTAAPSIEYSKKMFPGTFMGNSVTWTEYTTIKYTQREVFVDLGPEQKIHCWCYSHDPAVLEKLWAMVKTIK